MHVLGLPPAFVLSQDQTLKLKRHLCRVLDRSNLCTSLIALPLRYLSADRTHNQESLSIVHQSHRNQSRQTVKLTPISSVRKPNGPICKQSNRRNSQTTRIPLHTYTMSKSSGPQNTKQMRFSLQRARLLCSAVRPVQAWCPLPRNVDIRRGFAPRKRKRQDFRQESATSEGPKRWQGKHQL